MKIITSTERLYLREFVLEDAIYMCQINLDEDVIKYTGDVQFKSKIKAKTFLLNYNQYELYNMGRWAVCSKITDEFLGWCGLKFHPNSKINSQFIEVGYRFYKKIWNKGFATESCKASINYGFEVLKLKTIFAHTHINNLASHNVLKKCGLHFVNKDNYDGMPAYLYEIENPSN